MEQKNENKQKGGKKRDEAAQILLIMTEQTPSSSQVEIPSILPA
jgi:hypothetical protein